MQDTLIISSLAAQCRLGVTGQERSTPQTVWIDLELGIDAASAAAADDVKEAIDYAALVKAVKALAERTSLQLMETLGERIAQLVLERFDTSQVFVRVKKRALPGVDFAAVEVRRVRPAGRSRRMTRSPRGARG